MFRCRSALRGVLLAAACAACVSPGPLLTASPESLDFGDLVLREELSLSLQFTHERFRAYEEVEVAIAGDDRGHFSLVLDDCSGLTLEPQASCSVRVRFSPWSAGPKSAAVVVSTSLDGELARVPLRGVGVEVLALSTSESELLFGDVPEGRSAVQRVIVSVREGIQVGALGVVLSGTNVADFAVEEDNCSGRVVPDESSCSFVVRFSPSASGARTAQVTVSANPGGAVVVSLAGTGKTRPNMLAFEAVELDIGSSAVGTAIGGVVSLLNIGDELAGPIALSLSGSAAADFMLGEENCTDESLSESGSCNIALTFIPSATGTRRATLLATTAAGDRAELELEGTGLRSASLIAIPPNREMGIAATDRWSRIAEVELHNLGEAATGAIELTLDAATGTFEVVEEEGGCGGRLLGGGASCTVRIRFRSTEEGTVSATLVATASPGGTASFALSGEAVAPVPLVASTESYDFGLRSAGSASPGVAFTFRNEGSRDIEQIVAAIEGAGASDFTISFDGCSGRLEPAATCRVDVSFRPSTGRRSLSTLVLSGHPGSQAEVALSGFGWGDSELVADRESISFGPTPAGTVSEVEEASLSVSGSIGTGRLDATLTGDDANHFEVVDECAGEPLTPETSCTVKVVYAPREPGSHYAQLVVWGEDHGLAVVFLEGEAGEGPVVADVSELDLGPVPVGGEARERIRLTHLGIDPLGIPWVLLDGVSAPDTFEIGDEDCSVAPLDPGKSCEVEVVFTPWSDGEQEAVLTIYINGASTVEVRLFGTGVPDEG